MAFQLVLTSDYKMAFRRIAIKVPDVYSSRIFVSLYRSLKHYIDLLPQNPLIGQVEPYTEDCKVPVRRVVIKPYFKLIYYIDGDTIYFRDIWDTRQDPIVLIGKLDDLSV